MPQRVDCRLSGHFAGCERGFKPVAQTLLSMQMPIRNSGQGNEFTLAAHASE